MKLEKQKQERKGKGKEINIPCRASGRSKAQKEWLEGKGVTKCCCVGNVIVPKGDEEKEPEELISRVFFIDKDGNFYDHEFNPIDKPEGIKI